MKLKPDHFDYLFGGGLAILFFIIFIISGYSLYEHYVLGYTLYYFDLVGLGILTGCGIFVFGSVIILTIQYYKEVKK